MLKIPLKKFVKNWVETLWVFYSVHNQKGKNEKILGLSSIAIALKWDKEALSYYWSSWFFTYFPKKEEREELALELISDHIQEAKINWYTLRYDITITEEHKKPGKPF